MNQEDERLSRLEEQATHQTRATEELSEQVALQWQTIDTLTRKLDRLTERFLALEEASVEAPPVTRPPHF
jgi:SlyX protein